MQKPDTQTHVALLRGVNVGGVKLLMVPLRDLAQDLGWQNVRSYIASGNLIFSAKGENAVLADILQGAITKNFGVTTPILILKAEEFHAILNDHPWAPERGNQSHIYFCWQDPHINNSLYQEFKTANEELRIIGGHVHYHTPDGIGKSKLADHLSKVISGGLMTGRNLNTIRNLSKMLQE